MGHSLSPRSCPPTRSAPPERFGGKIQDCRSTTCQDTSLALNLHARQMTLPQATFCFVCGSCYSSRTQKLTLCRYKSHWNMDLKLRPFFLGGIMQGSGNKPPATNAKKAAYMMTDLERASKYFELNHKHPQNFWEVIVTKGTLKPQRFITAVDMKHPEFTEQLSRELWKRIYEEDIDATEPDSLKEAALKAGMSEAVINDALARMNEPEVKDRLKATTQEALDLGCFGAPFIVAHVNGRKEVFFGSDRFPVLAMVIGETWKGPIPGKSSKL